MTMKPQYTAEQRDACRRRHGKAGASAILALATVLRRDINDARELLGDDWIGRTHPTRMRAALRRAAVPLLIEHAIERGPGQTERGKRAQMPDYGLALIHHRDGHAPHAGNTHWIATARKRGPNGQEIELTVSDGTSDALWEDYDRWADGTMLAETARRKAGGWDLAQSWHVATRWIG